MPIPTFRPRHAMHPDYRKKLLKLLSDTEQVIADAEAVTVAAGDDATLMRASKRLAELPETRREIEAKLNG